MAQISDHREWWEGTDLESLVRDLPEGIYIADASFTNTLDTYVRDIRLRFAISESAIHRQVTLVHDLVRLVDDHLSRYGRCDITRIDTGRNSFCPGVDVDVNIRLVPFISDHYSGVDLARRDSEGLLLIFANCYHEFANAGIISDDEYRRHVLGEFPRTGEINNPDSCDRARELLLSELSEEQRQQYKKCGWFNVISKDGIEYRILMRYNYGVERAEDGKKFCLATKDDLPIHDVMLIQKILLENDPERFFRIANW